MNKEEWLKSICIIGMVFITIYIIYYFIKTKHSTMEYLSMRRKENLLPREVLSNLKNRNERMNNDLQINKYQNSYEDIIINYEELYYLDTIQKMLNAADNNERRSILSENALNVKGLDETAKFIYNH